MPPKPRGGYNVRTSKGGRGGGPAGSPKEEEAPAPPVNSNTWSAGSGGNVMDWLQKKVETAGAQESKSRGAIDFLKKQQKREKKETSLASASASAGPTIPAPRSQQQPSSIGGGNQAIKKLASMLGQPQDEDDMVPQVVDDSQQQGAIHIPLPASQMPPPQQQQQAPPSAFSLYPQQPSASAQPRPQPQASLRRNVPQQQQRGRNQQYPQHQQQQQQHPYGLKPVPGFELTAERYQEMQRKAEASSEMLAHINSQFQHQNSTQQSATYDARDKLDLNCVLELIDAHDVTFICTDTGSGKSTGVPRALLQRDPSVRIVSTQPRRTATIGVATRVSELMDIKVGTDVGYWIRGDKCGSDDTKLWYMTSYTLLLNLLNNPLKPPFTHIVLDEFHERQPDLEVIVAMLRLCLKNKTANFKLIIMSATLNTDNWEEYFQGLEVATFKQSEPEYPIHDYFIEDIAQLLGTDYRGPDILFPSSVDSRTLDQSIGMAQHLVMYINQYITNMHSILLFVPGRAQVDVLTNWVNMQMSHIFDVVPWHSTVDLKVIQQAIGRNILGRQKLYIATDIAECSITLPDVVFVLDLAMVKRPQITQQNPATIMYPPLMLQWVSKGSLSQRRGRVGRLQQGFYFCFVRKSHIPLLNDFSEPPIENSRIDELSLHCLQLVSNPVAIFSICRGQPLMETIASAMASLMSLGCIMQRDDPLSKKEHVDEVFSNEKWSKIIVREATNETNVEVQEYVITFIGRLLQLIPVSAQQGMLIFYGFLVGLESVAVLAAAVCCSLSPFSTDPYQDDATGDSKKKKKRLSRDEMMNAVTDTENKMKELSLNLRSDVVAAVNAVILYKIQKQERNDEGYLQEWCHQNRLSYEKVLNIIELDTHIKYELSAFVPFRDCDDPVALQSQLKVLGPLIPILLNASHAAQALEVTSEGIDRVSKEEAQGIFSSFRAVPDLHTPSCLRWKMGDVVVPINITVHFNKMVAGFSTCTASKSHFWLSFLLFAHRLGYTSQEVTKDGKAFHVFETTFNNRERLIKVETATSMKILNIRVLFSSICETLRVRYSHKEMDETEFNEVLDSIGLPDLATQQRNAVGALIGLFAPPQEGTNAPFVEEVAYDAYGGDGERQLEEFEFDSTTLLSFALNHYGM